MNQSASHIGLRLSVSLVAALLVALGSGGGYADAPVLIIPQEAEQTLPVSANKSSASTTVIESFNCGSDACLFTLIHEVQVDTVVDCQVTSRYFPPGSNTTFWDDYNNYPAASDSPGNGLGVQAIEYGITGSAEDACNRIDHYVRLYRDYANPSSSYVPFYGSCISVHFSDSYTIGKESAAVVVRPDVILQVGYVGGGTAGGRKTMSQSGAWESLSVNLDPTRAVSYVLLALGGSVAVSDVALFDNITVCDYSTTPPDCYLSTTALDFGVVEVGAHKDSSFTVANHGGGTIQGSISESCSHYQVVSGGGSYSLAADQARVVTVRYAPTSSGEHSCTIQLGTSACENVSCTGATTPACSVWASTLSFGEVDIGETGEMTFIVSNEGGGSLPVNVGLSCGPFQVVTANRNISLGPGELDSFTVRYTPVDEEGDSCSIGLGTSCGSIGMEGLGYIEPVCAVDPASIDFGTVSLGLSKDTSFTIRNDGGGNLAGLVGASCGPFSLLDADRSYSLSAGQSKTFSLRYAPEMEGAVDCSYSSGGDYCSNLPVSGRGEIPPLCTLLPNTLHFDRVLVGDSTDLSFSISNGGGGLVVGEVDELCGPFRIVETDRSYSLTSGESKVFTVRFSPVAEESSACVLATGVECGALSVDGAGYVPALCEIAPLSIDFGDVLIDTSAERTITIRNSGGDRLTGTLSAPCAFFSIVTADPTFELGGGEEKIFTLQFDPMEEVGYTCTLTAGDSCSPIRVEGDGIVEPVCELSVSKVDFGVISVDERPSTSFSIRNSGTGNLVGRVSGDCGPFHLVETELDYQLAANESKTYRVEFDPAGIGTYLCSLDVGLSCAKLLLSGVADPPPVCSISPQTIDFGVVFIGETRSTIIAITNTGGATLSGELDSLCGPFSLFEADRSYSLGAGDSKEFTLNFTPAESGPVACAYGGGILCEAIGLDGEGRDSCALSLASPVGGEYFTESEVRTISWTTGVCGGSVSIELYHREGDSAVYCGVIVDSTENDGQYNWTVAQCGDAGDNFLVRVALRERTGFDAFSPSVFTIDVAPGLDLPDTSLAADLDPVAVNPTAERSFQIVNRGARALQWSASSSEPWVSMATDSGAVGVGETLSVAIALDPSTLRGGDTTAVITILTDDPRMPVARVRVAANVRQYQRGDVTVNDVVNVLDIARLIDHITDETPLFPPIVRLGIADVNDDHAVDVSDLVNLSRLLSAGTPAKPSHLKNMTVILEREKGGAFLLRADGPENIRAGLIEIDWGDGGAPAGLSSFGVGGTTATLFNDRDRGITRIAFFNIQAVAVSGGPVKGAQNRSIVRITGGGPGDSPRVAGGSLAAGDRGTYELLGITPGAESLPAGGAILFFAPAPNPTRDGSNLSFHLPRRDRARLTVYDTAGRLVRLMADRLFSPGRHSMVWDGRDDSGRRTPNGVYFIRLEVTGESLSRKVILVR